MQTFMQTWLRSTARLHPRTKQHWVLLGLLGLGLSLMVALGQAVPADSPLGTLGWQGWFAVAVTIAALLANALTPLPAEIVFLGSLAALYVTGVLDEKSTLAGFGNAGMITVGVLYIVVSGLEQTGGLAWISQRVLGFPKGDHEALLRLMAPVAAISAFLNNTPVVAMFIPVVDDWCRKLRISPSKLMIPLSYAALFGGVCTLIGTSTNLVVNGLLIETGHPGLGLLGITGVGLPCAIAGVFYLLATHRWLLPNRKPAIDETDDPRQYTSEMVVADNSPLAGKTVEQAGLRHLPGLYLMEIVRGEQVIPAVSPREILQEQDQLVFVGMVNSMVDLHRIRGLQPATDQVFKLDAPVLNGP